MARRLHAFAVIESVGLLWLALAGAGHAQDVPAAARTLGCAEMEGFLKTARILSQRDLPVGITVPKRATLFDGSLRHDAAIQTTDIKQLVFESDRGTELNFRDSWQFNVAGYELAKLLQLNMVPPYVERNVLGKDASVTWWIADAMMGRDRYRKKIQPPDPARWNAEIYAMRIFHQLIYDTDPNLTNMLITKDWRIWMIDFSRAFRWTAKLQNPKALFKSDRRLLERLRQLDAGTLQERLGRWLGKPEIEAILARRDLIVRHFEGEIAKRGEAAVLYDLPRTAETCGFGLQ